jgi:Tol biopolymer transport system component/DNA-binding winged helix-turn-helix (wHTH) protein
MNRRETLPPPTPQTGTRTPVVYAFRGFRLDPRRRLLTGAADEPVAITAKSYDVLLLLVQQAGELVSRAELIRSVWPTTVVEENNLNQAIAALRRALGDGYIVTVAGKGYQFVAPVVIEHPGSAHGAPPGSAPALVHPEPSAGSWQTPAHQEQSTSAGLPAPFFARRSARFVAALTAVAVLAVLALAALFYRSLRAPPGTADPPLGTVASITRLTSFPGDENMPAFSPDGTRIAFSWSPEGGEQNLYVTQIGGGEPLQLTRGDGADRDPAWSPDGMQIAFMRQHDPARLDLVLVSALGGAERVLQPITLHFVSREASPRLAWTPDGRQLLFTTQREGPTSGQVYELRVIDIGTGRVRPLNIQQSGANYDTSPALTANGRQLAFVRFTNRERLGRLMLQDLGDDLQPLGPPRQVPGVVTSTPHSLSWSHDGRLLRFIVGENIMEWRAGGQARVVHTMSTQLGAIAMLSTAAGTRAAATVLNRDEDIWAVPLDATTHTASGRPVARAKSTSFERHPQFSPDGRHLAFISGRSGKAALWISDVGGAHPRQLSHFDEYVTGFPRWSPDGTRIAFHTSARNQERTIYTVDPRGGTPVKLGAGCCPTGWSADARYLYVGDLGTINRAARMRAADGQRETLFQGDFTVESMDGTQLLYARLGEPGVFTRSVRGDIAHNPEVKLVDDYRLTLGGFVPVKDGFYYLGHTPTGQPQAFRFYDYASRKVHDVVPAPSSVGLGLAVSPDGRELLYSSDASGAGADLMLIEFAR